MQIYFWSLRLLAASTLITLATPSSAPAQASPTVHVVYMGGSDCPPCVHWRASEYPKLAATDVYKRIQYSHVVKVVRSGVPAKFFLPQEVKPLKEKLDYAANGMTGSPHTVIVVNGKVFDYQFGVYSAVDFEARLLAILSGGPYPFPRCTRRQNQQLCEPV